jgi:hypothetical protein
MTRRKPIPPHRKKYIAFRWLLTRLYSDLRTGRQIADRLNEVGGFSRTQVYTWLKDTMPSAINLLKLTEATGDPRFAQLLTPAQRRRMDPFDGVEAWVAAEPWWLNDQDYDGRPPAGATVPPERGGNGSLKCFT